MPAHLRFPSSPWTTQHVVSRCIQGYAFLKPTQQIRKVTRGVFTYSADLFYDRIQIHHFAFLSNHFHLLLSAESSQGLAEFMCHFKGNLAHGVDNYRVLKLQLRVEDGERPISL